MALITLSVKNSAKREMPDVTICDEVIALAIAVEQSDTDGILQLDKFLTQRVIKAKK